MNKKYNITITYPDVRETSPDGLQQYTKVIHLNENDKLLKIINDNFMASRSVKNVELHIEEVIQEKTNE